MPSHKNGRSEGSAAPQPLRVLRLGDLTPERVPVDAGEGRMLLAWVCTNQRYPASVAAELEDARNEYLNSRDLVTNGPPPPDLIQAAQGLIDVIPEDGSPPSTASLKEPTETLRAALKRFDPSATQYRAHARDWEAYLTRCLTTLIPGLENWEADLMPPDQRLGWLFDLGYFQREQAQPEAITGEGQRPPEQDTSSTGDTPEPDLVASTT